MSEFMCRNHHQMSCRDHKCPICGSPVAYMDGLSDRELRRIEEEDEEGRPSRMSEFRRDDRGNR